MRLFQVDRRLRLLARSESGMTLIETLVLLVILGTIAVTFLSGLFTIYKATAISDEQATAESLAQSQVEYVKKLAYVYNATEYALAPIPDGKDYVGYSATVTAEPLQSPDAGIQKIVVTIKHSDKGVFRLEGYKAER